MSTWVFQTQRTFPYSYFPETTSRNGRGAGLSKKQLPQTQQHILWSHARRNWICDLVQGQGPKMRHHSLWCPEFDEILTSFLSRYSWKPLWRIYQGYGHSLGTTNTGHICQVQKQQPQQNQILKPGNSVTKKWEPKGRYRSSDGKLGLQKTPSEMWQQPAK